MLGVMPDTKEEIERCMDELAREYGRTPRGDPRREEIAKELSALCERLDRLIGGSHQSVTGLVSKRAL
jgi:hypothetical protein